MRIFYRLLTIVSIISISRARRILFDTDDCAACKITTADWLASYGYPCISIEITTKDGYRLQIFRILHGKGESKTGAPRVPVLLQHGANGLSDNYVLTMDNINDTYPTRLADAGFDVWLSNLRGSRYARHQKYSRLDYAYWNFTMDDWVLDLKDTVDYILEETKFPSIAVVAHSVGGVIVPMLVGDHPEYNDKIHYCQLLSPVAYLTKNPYVSAHPSYGLLSKAGPKLVQLSEFLVEHELLDMFGGLSANGIKLISEICISNKALFSICTHAIGFGIGFDHLSLKNVTKASTMEIFLDLVSQSACVKFETQSMQMGLASLVQKYDYKKKNEIVYGQSTPPKYGLSNIELNVRVYYPKNDVWIDRGDNEHLFEKLKNANLSVHEMKYENFNHFDYFYGKARFRFLDLATRDMTEFHEGHSILPV